MTKVIGIMGCGWLGLPLAKSFLAQGHTVHGTTTSQQKSDFLRQEGIVPFVIRLGESNLHGPIAQFMETLDVLIINVPPRLRKGKGENYVQKMQHLHLALKAAAVQKIIFVSSTSVYGNIDGTITEETPARPHTESAKQLLESEGVFKEDTTLRKTVVRFGGLIGPNRHPVTTLSGRKDLANGEAPINLIHQNDCIAILKAIVQKNWWDETFNAVYPHHPSKQEYYRNEALKRNLPPPEYAKKTSFIGKKIDSSKLIRVKYYSFNTSV